MKEEYDYYWDQYNPKTYNNRMGIYKTKREMDFIKSFLSENSNILDIGGGSGRFAIPLTKLNHNLTIVDKSKNAVMMARRRGIVDGIEGDFMNISFSSSFGIILAIEVIHYVPNLGDMLNKIRYLLSDNGVFIFTAVNKNSWRFKLRSLKKNICKYYNEYNLKEYKAILTESKFKIVRINGFLWMPFQLASNNHLIPYIEKAEEVLSLNKRLSQSPWYLFAVQKMGR